MKFRPILPILFFLCVFLHSQTSAVEITAEPSHHQILQNDYVRVFDVEAAPHASTQMHWHLHDYFFVTLGAASVSNEVAGKPAATLKLQDGETSFVAGNFAHIAKNLSDQPFRNVTIEFLKDAEVHKTPPPKWDEARALHVHHNGTQEVLFVQDGVRVSDFELQPGGMVHNQHHPGPRLIVAVNDLDIKSVAGKNNMPIQLKSGGVMWLKGGTTDMLMNTGKNSAKWITLEFH